ncbi:MAG: hypothetical protein PHV34_22490 [Verrucomicrobiae bacterium]|nr:hypothetical protein [Verrucomicrobiae bacterium]
MKFTSMFNRFAKRLGLTLTPNHAGSVAPVVARQKRFLSMAISPLKKGFKIQSESIQI